MGLFRQNRSWVPTVWATSSLSLISSHLCQRTLSSIGTWSHSQLRYRNSARKNQRASFLQSLSKLIIVSPSEMVRMKGRSEWLVERARQLTQFRLRWKRQLSNRWTRQVAKTTATVWCMGSRWQVRAWTCLQAVKTKQSQTQDRCKIVSQGIRATRWSSVLNSLLALHRARRSWVKSLSKFKRSWLLR